MPSTRVEELKRARVIAVFRDQCLLRFSDGERSAEVTGRFRYVAHSRSEYPAVGDWVMASIVNSEFAMIYSIGPRTSILSRKVAGKTTEEQVLAANVSVVFVVTSFNEDFNLRRLERYLVLVRQAAVDPVILINKSDLIGQNNDVLEKTVAAIKDVPIYRVSAASGEGLSSILTHLHDGHTGLFLGSSGVGKSTIINQLLGEEIQTTQTIRLSDSKGRHTTTTRQMFTLPNGGLVIDTPGLREIQPWGGASAISDVYSDIVEIAKQCQFRDCRHQAEKNCAVAEALRTGELALGRWKGYTKLQKELAYLRRKQNPEFNANTKKRWKSIHKTLRDVIKNKRG